MTEMLFDDLVSTHVEWSPKNYLNRGSINHSTSVYSQNYSHATFSMGSGDVVLSKVAKA